MSTSQWDGPCAFVYRNGLQGRAHSSPSEFVDSSARRSRVEVDPQPPVLHRSRQNRKVSCGAVHRNCERDRPQFRSVSSEQHLVGQLDETRSRDEHVAAERRKTHSSPGPLEKPCTELLLEPGDAPAGHGLRDPSGRSAECHAAEFADSGECSTGVYQVHHLMVCAIGMRADVSVFDCMADADKTVSTASITSKSNGRWCLPEDLLQMASRRERTERFDDHTNSAASRFVNIDRCDTSRLCSE
jgi:hypothetical protein